MSSSHHRNSTFPTSLLLFSIRTINHNSTGSTLLKVDYFFFVSFPDQISNENCVRPLTIFQSVSTFRVIELKPAALDCQSEMSSFLSKPLRYLFITQLKQNRSLQAKTVFPKIPTDYVDPFMGEGRGGECLHERIFLCRDFPALIASRSRHLARGNACQQVTNFVFTLIGWNCILALWLAILSSWIQLVSAIKTYLFSLISISVGL